MDKIVHTYFEKDHRRLDALFEAATKDITAIDETLYHQFRTGLLTHIKMEEKILFKMAQEDNNGTLLPMQAQLRLEHGALTSLLVCFPSPEVVKVIRHLLSLHNFEEEKDGGMYDQCAELTQARHDELFASLDSTTEVPVHPINRSPKALIAAKNAVKRAGYGFDKIAAVQD